MDGGVALESMARPENHTDGLHGTLQGILEAGIGGDAALRLRDTVTDSSESLVDAYNARFPGRGTEHSDVLRSPITRSDDGDSYSYRSHLHIPLFVFGLRVRSF
jgi:hypothetical protein